MTRGLSTEGGNLGCTAIFFVQAREIFKWLTRRVGFSGEPCRGDASCVNEFYHAANRANKGELPAILAETLALPLVYHW